MTLDFSRTTFLKLKAKKLGDVVLTKTIFEHVIVEREREHIIYNEQLFRETLRNPDNIKESNEDCNLYFYSKKTQRYYLKPDTTVDVSKFRYFTVLVDRNRRFIITMYSCPRIQGGNQVWPTKTQS